mmetsp:Transcript_5095/g.20482  ORF Transcript_5095/g.20482 Transcript_5095/m.20482 type:complete len:324 (-) Transcript_5095:21-992(-)
MVRASPLPLCTLQYRSSTFPATASVAAPSAASFAASTMPWPAFFRGARREVGDGDERDGAGERLGPQGLLLLGESCVQRLFRGGRAGDHRAELLGGIARVQNVPGAADEREQKNGGTPPDGRRRVARGDFAGGVIRLDADFPAREPAHEAPEVLAEVHLGAALAPAVDALPLLGRCRGVIRQARLAVLPQPLLPPREPAHQRAVAAGLAHETLLVVGDVLALAHVQIIAAARGLVPGGGAALARALAGHGYLDVRKLDVRQVDLGHVGKVFPQLVDLVVDGGGAASVAAARQDARAGRHAGGGEGRDGRHVSRLGRAAGRGSE